MIDICAAVSAGAVVTQLKQPWRRGEYAPVIRFYQGAGIPLRGMITAGAIEGGDVVLVAPGTMLIGNGEDALIKLSGSTLSNRHPTLSGATVFDVVDTFGGAPAAELVAASSVTLAGPLLSAIADSTVTALFHVLNVTRSSFVSTTEEALIQLAGSETGFTTVDVGGPSPFSTPTANAITRGRLVSVFGGSSGTAGLPGFVAPADASISLSGPVLYATRATILATADLIGVFNGGLLTSSTPTALMHLVDSTVTTGAPAAVGLPAIAGTLVNISGQGGTPGIAAALLELTGDGGLLHAENSTITTSGTVLTLSSGGQLRSATVSPLLAFGNTDVTAGTTVDHRLVTVSGGPLFGSLEIHGSLIDATTGSTLSSTGNAVGVFNGTLLDALGAAPLIALDASTLTTGTPGATEFGGALLHASGMGGAGDTQPARVNLSGALLRAGHGSTVTVHGNLVHASIGAIVNAPPAAPLVHAFDGSTLVVDANALSVSSGATVNFTNELLLMTHRLPGEEETGAASDLTVGRALVREKVVAACSRRLVILVGEEKLVPRLGTRGRLPVEVTPFALSLCERRLRRLGCQPVPCMEGSSLFVSDNGNHILDCGVEPIADAQRLELDIRAIPGVVGTGLFLGMADIVLVGDRSDFRMLEERHREDRPNGHLRETDHEPVQETA